MPVQGFDVQPYDSLFTFQKELDRSIYPVKGFYIAFSSYNRCSSNRFLDISRFRIFSAWDVYLRFYNYQRLHQSLDYQMPAEVHFGVEKEIPSITANSIVPGSLQLVGI